MIVVVIGIDAEECSEYFSFSASSMVVVVIVAVEGVEGVEVVVVIAVVIKRRRERLRSWKNTLRIFDVYSKSLVNTIDRSRILLRFRKYLKVEH